MKSLQEILKETIAEPIKLTEEKHLLFEEDDFGGDDAGGGDDGGDPFGGDDGGDPFGGDDGGGDPFGGGDGGSSGGGDSGDDENAEGDDGEEEDQDKSEELDLEGHEDDPEFYKGKYNKDDMMLPEDPGAGAMIDLEQLMQTVASLVAELSEDQLAEYKQVKKCMELLGNGKILKDEDLEFKNVQNAIFLIEKICGKLDIKTGAYILRKFKEPLILKRDTIKQDIADKKNDLNATRDTVIKLDAFKVEDK